MQDNSLDGMVPGSQVLSEEDRQYQDKRNEDYAKVLIAAMDSGKCAKEWLNTALGRKLRKFIIDNKQRAAITVASSEIPAEVASAQKDFDVIQGVEQFFAEMIQTGNLALQNLEVKERH